MVILWPTHCAILFVLWIVDFCLTQIDSFAMASLIVSDKAEAFGYNNVCVAGVNCIRLLGDTPMSPKDKSKRKREKYKVGAENPHTPMLHTETSDNGTKEYCDIIVYTLNTQAWDKSLTQHYENLPSYKVDSRDISGGVLRSVLYKYICHSILV